MNIYFPKEIYVEMLKEANALGMPIATYVVKVMAQRFNIAH